MNFIQMGRKNEEPIENSFNFVKQMEADVENWESSENSFSLHWQVANQVGNEEPIGTPVVQDVFRSDTETTEVGNEESNGKPAAQDVFRADREATEVRNEEPIGKSVVEDVFRADTQAQLFEKKLIERLYPKNVNRAALKKEPFWTGQNSDQIGVWLRLLFISNVSTEEQTLTARVSLNLTWLDVEWTEQMFANQPSSKPFPGAPCQPAAPSPYKAPGMKAHRINERKENTDQIILDDPEDCPSLPKYRIENQVDDIELIFENVKVSRDGCIVWQKWFNVKINDPVVAKNFPFDYQDFTIDFRLMEGSMEGAPLRYFCSVVIDEDLKHYRQLSELHDIRHTGENLVDKFYSRTFLSTSNLAVPEWEVCSLFGKQGVAYEKELRTNVTPFAVKTNLKAGWDGQYTCYFVIKRRSAYYMVHIWSLYSMFVLVAMVSFSLDAREQLDSRQQICISSIFVLIALKFTFGNEVPKLPYLTIYDCKVYTSMVLLVVLMVLQSILPVMTNDDDILVFKDRVMFYCFASATFLVDFGLFCRAKYVQIAERRELERNAKEMCQYPEMENISIAIVY